MKRPAPQPKHDVAAADLDAAQVISLLARGRRLQLVTVGGPPLAPFQKHHTIWRGRLRGQLIESIYTTYEGWRKPQRIGTPTKGLGMQIRVSRGLQTSGQPLPAPFEDYTDSDVHLASLAAHLLAYLAGTDPALPLFLTIDQNWKKGYAPGQTIRLPADEHIARRLIDHLATAFRWDLDAQPNHLPDAAPAGSAAGSAGVSHRAEAGDQTSFLPQGKRSYYAQYPTVRGVPEKAKRLPA